MLIGKILGLQKEMQMIQHFGLEVKKALHPVILTLMGITWLRKYLESSYLI